MQKGKPEEEHSHMKIIVWLNWAKKTKDGIWKFTPCLTLNMADRIWEKGTNVLGK